MFLSFLSILLVVQSCLKYRNQKINRIQDNNLKSFVIGVKLYSFHRDGERDVVLKKGGNLWLCVTKIQHT